jgi:hypothetical protein
LEFGKKISELRIWGLWFGALMWFRVKGLGFRVKGLGFRV